MIPISRNIFHALINDLLLVFCVCHVYIAVSQMSFLSNLQVSCFTIVNGFSSEEIFCLAKKLMSLHFLSSDATFVMSPVS